MQFCLEVKLHLRWFKLPENLQILRTLNIKDVAVQEEDLPDAIIEANIHHLRPLVSKNLWDHLEGLGKLE